MSDRSVLEPPGWVLQIAGRDGGWRQHAGSLHSRVRSGGEFTLVSIRLDDAVSLDERDFREGAAEVYRTLGTVLAHQGAITPARIWNFVPQILEPLGTLPHRYMVFNAGRYDAYLAWYGSFEEMARRAATASGVGHRGTDLLVHCLAALTPGQPIENPRQTPAYLYSRHHGPVPPCFARATRLERPPGTNRTSETSGTRWGDLLLVGGTASVVGEECTHASDVGGQLSETCRNLQAILGVAAPDPEHARRARPESVRVYYVRGSDEPFLRRAVPLALGHPAELEYIEADLCRPQLLVEIEAIYAYRVDEETAAA